ncbi:DUF6701 domain-containing protein [Shewanella waksmanii]|uniref:DUF6701 domain-containing protein n=1 Tax=Shewanella waksmanii TaxID=213783 RepID=UPI0004AE8D86|nr:DUF6701 domain-containing protein [Shewanella waksmanii]
MNKPLLAIIALVCLLPFSVMAVPQCDEIFTDPPSGNHFPNGMQPPSDIGPSLGNLTCRKQGQNRICTPAYYDFTPGDYNFAAGTFSQGNYINTDGASTRLYFDSLTLNQARLNEFGNTEDLIIYVRGSLSVAGQNFINGIVYVAGSVSLSGNASIDGALASGGALDISGNGDVEFDPEAIEDADFGGMCENGPEEPLLPPVPLQCPAEQDGIAGVTYRTYDANNWKPGVTASPEDHDEFNQLIDTVKKTTEQLGESIESSISGYGLDINPHSDQGDFYLGIFEGYINVPESGVYTFGIDGDDAIELLIDDQVVVGFYGLHSSCNAACETGTIGLEAGTHKVEMRFHEATGYEAYDLYWQLPSSSSLVRVPSSAYLTCPFPEFEFGRVTLDGSGNATIEFDNQYDTAPVVLLMPTINGIDGSDARFDGPSDVRISSYAANHGSVSILQDNPPRSSTNAKAMVDIDYFVMEPGYRFLSRGSALQADKVDTIEYQGRRLPASGRGYEDVEFNHQFGSKPTVVAQTLSRNNNRFITPVVNNVDSDGDEFDIAIETSEIAGNITTAETLGYVAGLGRGTMTVNGEAVLYEFAIALNHGDGNRTRRLDQQCDFNNSYQNSYPAQPLTIASKMARRGGDGGWTRRCLKDDFSGTLSFVIDEDQYSDNDRNHLAEDIGYFAFEYAPEPPAVNHYRIEFSSGALSCAAKPITIRSCANDDCTSLTSVTASVELTKNDTFYSTEVFTGQTVPAADLWHGDGGTVKVGLGATSPSGPYRCFIDGVEVANIDQCLLTFDDNGFYFDVPNTLAGKTTDEFQLFAVAKDTQTQQCGPLFSSETKTVDFSFDYLNPSSVNNPAALTLASLNSVAVSESIDGGSSASLDVSFDANGIARLQATYPEAGQVSLAASHVLVLEDGESVLLEHQDNFVAAPAGFHFYNATNNGTCSAGDPYDASCQILAKSGEGFTMLVKAVKWESEGDNDFSDNVALQNFEHSAIAINPQVHQPSNGASSSFGVTSIDFALASGESAEQVLQTWNEVGTVTAQLSKDLVYFDMTIAKENYSSEIFGRFTPAYLAISANTPELDDACGSFSYMDQPMSYAAGAQPKIEVIGHAKSGAITSNYQNGDWWRYMDKDIAAQNQWSGRSYTDKSTVATVVDGEAPGLSGSVSYLTLTANSVYLASGTVKYQRGTAPVAPFDALFDLTLAIEDVTDADGICYKADYDGSCLSYTFTNIGEDKNIGQRYGRLVLDNGYGPQSESLRLPLRTEYVSAVDAVSGNPTWITNTDDSCSVFNTLASVDDSEIPETGLFMDYPNGFPEIDAFVEPSLLIQSSTISNGVGNIYFQVPNTTGEVPLKQHVAPWLKWYWNWDGAGSTLYDPRASGFWGTYRGHDKVIFWREVR